jgi:vacuolar-type H+-ATPase subunit E/Vma4
MSRELSVARILAELKDQVEHHRGQGAYHAEQEVFHRQQKELHAADLEVALKRLETFEAAADAAGELVAKALEKKQREKAQEKVFDDSIPAGKGAVLSKLVARVVFGREMDQDFGASDVTQEVEERFGARLKRKIDVRSVAAKLRRMARSRQIHRVREGRSFHESLYRRGPG